MSLETKDERAIVYKGWNIYEYESQIWDGLKDLCARRPSIYKQLVQDVPETEFKALLNDIASEYESSTYVVSEKGSGTRTIGPLGIALIINFLRNINNLYLQSQAKGRVVDPALPKEYPINVIRMLCFLWNYAVLTKEKDYRPPIAEICGTKHNRVPKASDWLTSTQAQAQVQVQTPTLQQTETKAQTASAPAAPMQWLATMPMLVPVPVPGSSDTKATEIKDAKPLFVCMSLTSTDDTKEEKESKRSTVVTSTGCDKQQFHTPYVVFLHETMREVNDTCLRGVSNRLWFDVLSIQDQIIC